jgi:hypothetical protein
MQEKKASLAVVYIFRHCTRADLKPHGYHLLSPLPKTKLSHQHKRDLELGVYWRKRLYSDIQLQVDGYVTREFPRMAFPAIQHALMARSRNCIILPNQRRRNDRVYWRRRRYSGTGVQPQVGGCVTRISPHVLLARSQDCVVGDMAAFRPIPDAVGRLMVEWSRDGW